MNHARMPMPKYREMTASDNAAVAALVRDNLKKFNLDIPGTVYFDEGLDHLSDYYGNDERRYYVIEDDNGEVIGGIGYDRFEPMKDTAELQKLYLTDSAKGSGLGYEMIDFIEDKMREAGYKASYLEIHNNLQAAIHIYELKYRIVTDSSEVDALNSLTRWAKMLNKNLTLFTIKLTLKDTDKIIGIFFLSRNYL